MSTSPANKAAKVLAIRPASSLQPVPKIVSTVRKLIAETGQAGGDPLISLTSQRKDLPSRRMEPAHCIEDPRIRARQHEPLKRTVDLVGALLISLAIAPFLALIAWAIWCEGDGPIVYRHRRIGRGGVSFDCLKFRTMVTQADQVLHEVLARNPDLRREWLRDHKLRDDPRVTFVGRLLRRSSLDELPQLWNVIRGEMSLVGPRPIVREELLKYGHKLHDYLSATPGMTGLWQVMGRNNTTYRRRVALDSYYVHHRSLSLDAYILLKTVGVVVGGDGAC